MVKHIILWKLNESLTDEEKNAVRKAAKEGLEGLVGKIDGLVSLTVVTESLPTSTADLMLDSTFTDADALAGYAVHPLHVAAAQVMRKNAAVRLCLDF